MQENPETIVDASLFGTIVYPSIKCKLHLASAKNCVAFDGIENGRRFYGCGAEVSSDGLVVLA